jgi:hypothetical protein
LTMRLEDIAGALRPCICGDNKAMLCVMKSCINPTMRHLARTHRISVAWLHEHEREDFDFQYVGTDGMASDVFTKSIPNPLKVVLVSLEQKRCCGRI